MRGRPRSRHHALPTLEMISLGGVPLADDGTVESGHHHHPPDGPGAITGDEWLGAFLASTPIGIPDRRPLVATDGAQMPEGAQTAAGAQRQTALKR